uniref:1,3-beta-glucan synthase component FKS1-like domain-containing protein n=1 Tax=Lactuca sativa TaxID=4236 RepID=A0A9R1W678_LACSA|nr:hypothetical protein LSAT_V11C300121290 [Lactuca sativa]
MKLMLLHQEGKLRHEGDVAPSWTILIDASRLFSTALSPFSDTISLFLFLSRWFYCSSFSMVLFIGFLKSTKVTATFDQSVSPPSVPSVMRYKRVHRVDEIQIEEQRMLESGTFSSDMGGIQAINKDRKLFLVSLYYLIWDEAANVRFLPECICYRFHHEAERNNNGKAAHSAWRNYDDFNEYF